MYTILIVDDEKLARENISYIVGKSGIPFEWIMEASSAEEALEVIRINRPDILFTDIKMGKKSGLDLLEEAKSLHTELVSVIICGYPDFNYAQRAVSLGIASYLLKPVKTNEIKEVLSNVTQIIREKREQKLLHSDHYLLTKTLNEHKLQEDVNAFVTSGELGSRNTLKQHFIECSPAWYQMIIIYIDSEDMPISDRNQNNDILTYGIKNIAQELAKSKVLIATSMEHKNILIAIISSNQKDSAAAKEEFEKYALEIKQAVEQALLLKTMVSLSDVHSDLIPDMYTEASLALDLRFSLESKAEFCILKYFEYANKVVNDDHDASLTLLRRLLNMNDIYNSIATAAEMISYYRNKPEIGIRNTYRSIIGAISAKCYKNGFSILPILGSENISGSIINTFSSIEDVHDNLSNILIYRLGDLKDENEQENIWEIVQRVKKYIDDSFMDANLSTNALSKHFCISLGYLSASYKKEHGVTISKYIISKRISYAEKLLNETDLTVSEIAESSGFNNLSYFMRLFKMKNGMTPLQYRNTGKKVS